MDVTRTCLKCLTPITRPNSGATWQGKCSLCGFAVYYWMEELEAYSHNGNDGIIIPDGCLLVIDTDEDPVPT